MSLAVPAPAPAAPLRRGQAWLWAGLIVAAGIFIYWPALRGGWLWDDDTEITRNPILGDPAGWWKIWIKPTGPDYFPLKTFLQWCEWHLWRDQVLYYHLVSLGFHLAGALLVWRLLAKIGLRRAYWGGLLFAIHPLCVESVAWISELKNVMSLPLLLLALTAYAGSEPGKRGYGWALGWFAAALLCKTSGVMLPAVLLLYAWWRRGRWSPADIFASAPFLALAVILGAVTVWFQQHRSIAAPAFLPSAPLWRMACAGLIATFYFCKALLPVGLLPIYPRWSVDPARAVEFLPWLVALGLGAWLWARRDRAGRHALFGLGFFFINLAPVLGFVAISHLRFTWTMDHLSYVALIGLVGVAVAGADRLLQPGAFGFAATGVALLLAMQSHSYARNYRSEVALWEYTLSRNPHAWLAETNLGSYLLADGRTEEALRLLQASVQENPDFAQARNNLGNGLRQAGRLPEATASYRRAVELRPEGAEFHNNLALALAAAGQRDEAIAELETAVRLKPGFGEARNNLGVYLARAGRTDEATRQFEEAVRADPDNAEAHANWGAMLLAAGRRAVALREIREALRLNPTLINAQKLLDRAQAQRGPKADLAPSP